MTTCTRSIRARERRRSVIVFSRAGPRRSRFGQDPRAVIGRRDPDDGPVDNQDLSCGRSGGVRGPNARVVGAGTVSPVASTGRHAPSRGERGLPSEVGRERTANHVVRSQSTARRVLPPLLTSGVPPGACDEAYLSTEHPETCPQARLPPTHAYPGRAGHHQGPPSEGPDPPLGLIRRLSHRNDFDALRRHGRTVRRGSLRVRYLAGQNPEARVAYGIGRSVGNAVVRNRLRRRLRVVMTSLDAHGGLPAGDYLVRAEPSAAMMSFAELSDALDGITADLGSKA